MALYFGRMSGRGLPLLDFVESQSRPKAIYGSLFRPHERPRSAFARLRRESKPPESHLWLCRLANWPSSAITKGVKRVSLTDISAAAIVAFVVLLPPQTVHVASAYYDQINLEALPERSLQKIARLQAAIGIDPSDLESIDHLAELLGDLGHTDESLRLAGSAIKRTQPNHWQALVTISAAHADRIEFTVALEWLNKAIAVCEASSGGCRVDQRARMDIYGDELGRAIEAVNAGINPRIDPEGFREKVQGKRRPPVRVN